MRSRRAVAAAILMAAIPAFAAEAQGLIAAQEKRIESADFRAIGRLVRVDENGDRTSAPITVEAHWFPGALRVRVKVGSTGKGGDGNKGTHLLLEMKANGESSIRIAHKGDKAFTSLPPDQWRNGPLGGTFSYEDFLEPQWFWPEQIALPSAMRGARKCDVLKSRPGPGLRTQYSGVTSWLDHGIGFPVYLEKTLKASGRVKEFTYMGLRQTGGIWSASQIEVKLRGEKGSTLLVIDRGSTKADLTAADFDAAQLLRF